MITPAKGYKIVYAIYDFIVLEKEFPHFHGVLHFSTLEKLNEMCKWDRTHSMVCKTVVKEDFDDMDYVPDNY